MRTIFLLLVSIQTLQAQPDRFGLPSCPGHLARRVHYVVCFDTQLRAPLWTAHELQPETANASKRRTRFRKDRELNSHSAAAFTNSGFDRGHLVPARDLPGDEQTFLVSNVVPQNPAVNRGPMRKLEAGIRAHARPSASVIVVTRPTYGDCGVPGFAVPVPCAIEKIVLVTTAETRACYAIRLPNRPGAQPEALVLDPSQTFPLLQNPHPPETQSQTFEKNLP